jgi:hypothetical protein
MAPGRGLPLLGSRGDPLGFVWGPGRAGTRASDRLLRRPRTVRGALAQCGSPSPARLLLCLCIAFVCGALLFSSGTLLLYLPSQAHA